MNIRLIVSALLIALAAALAVSCGGQQQAPASKDEAAAPAKQADAAPAAKEEAAPAKPAAGNKLTIKLAENPWSGSQVNVAVAKILLEEKLGHAVEVVTIDENAQWPALSSGDLHASLEIWPSGHVEDVKQYIDGQKVVENLGPLGVVGEIGWYMPSYVLKDHPELATWEGFKNPDNAKLFATAETGNKGQFLAGDPSWVQYDGDIIKNLGLNLEVVTAGSEQAILAQLDAANSRKAPILFYFWTPHSVHAQYELTQVKLPPYSKECYDKAASGGVACGYPPDNLFKIAWVGLKDAAPDVYLFLKNFNYTTKDQISMIAAVELDKKTPEAAAREWLDQNPQVWQAWLPK